MKNIFRIGTILIAIDRCGMAGYGKLINALTINKEYKVKIFPKGVPDFAIKDDQNDVHWFSVDEEDPAYWKHFFKLKSTNL